MWLFNCGNHGHNPEKHKIDSLRINVLGLWSGPNEDSPIWKITADSIYYFQEKKAYKYTLHKDSLVIQFPDHSYSLRDMSVIGDTMIFKDDIGKVYAYRFKSNGTPNFLK